MKPCAQRNRCVVELGESLGDIICQGSIVCVPAFSKSKSTCNYSMWYLSVTGSSRCVMQSFALWCEAPVSTCLVKATEAAFFVQWLWSRHFVHTCQCLCSCVCAAVWGWPSSRETCRTAVTVICSPTSILRVPLDGMLKAVSAAIPSCGCSMIICR